MESTSVVSGHQLVVPDASNEEYQTRRKETDLREPYRFPQEVLENSKNDVVYDVAESPMIAFINARAGGRMGPELLTSLYRALGNAQVYDVLKDRPDVVLKTIWGNLDKLDKAGDPRAQEIKRRMKIVACGGDGTVAWVMKVIKDLELDPPPAVAIVPLGTGNDLSRTYKWGRTFKPKWIRNSSALYDHLKEMSDGVYKELDCWSVDVRAPSKDYFDDLPYGLKANSEDGSTVTGCAWNYLSIGMDAQSAYGFHHLREAHPALASGRLINQFWYSFYGLKSGWFCCCNSLNPPLNQSIQIEILTKGDEWKKIEMPNSVKALVLVNLQSYAGGRNIWGRSKVSKKEAERGLTEPKLNDGLFEVVGFHTGWHTGFVMVGLAHCIRLGQGKAARIRAQRAKGDPAGEVQSMYVQIDGEPWKQRIPTSEGEILAIDVVHNGCSSLLMNKRKMTERDLERQPTEPSTSSPVQGTEDAENNTTAEQ